MYEPLAVDIFTDKNKKDPPSAHVSSVFVCKLGSRVFRVLPKVLWSQRPPFCLAEHPSPSPFASASPGKASRRHTRIATFPWEEKPVVLTTTLNMLQF